MYLIKNLLTQILAFYAWSAGLCWFLAVLFYSIFYLEIVFVSFWICWFSFLFWFCFESTIFVLSSVSLYRDINWWTCCWRHHKFHIYTLHEKTQPFYGPSSETTRVSWYKKKHSHTHHPGHHQIIIGFFRLLWSIASSLFKLCAWQSFCTTSVHILFGLPLGLEPSTSYSIHFFTQSVSSFCNICKKNLSV